ncbi:AGAP009296-PA [Anopheles gambiae str. PEST]|uniref:Splicing factor 45 n=1 Tax=Anopheles gambiae TaxID=7165 RepID=Q7PVF2_ANOGA|nr:AGAP009296-PA [Anopheles gambiae str. PEST]
MALYDDLDTKHGPDKVAGWSSGLKLFQPQLQVKKVNQPAITPKAILRKPGSKTLPFLAASGPGPTTSLIDPSSGIVVKSAKGPITVTTTNATPNPISAAVTDDYNWDVVDEYDPMWPNEYDKLVKDRKAKEPPIKPLQGGFGRNRREYKRSGFAGRPSSDDEEEFRPGQSRPSGAAIAPPPSLQESCAGGIPSEGGSKYVRSRSHCALFMDATFCLPSDQNSRSLSYRVSQLAAYGGSSVAAKIMAKYGFKDGQGLGKQEQGMAVALQVEKTSKRGGRIVHEKDISATTSTVSGSGGGSGSGTEIVTTPPSASQGAASEPSITEIMKSPSKVVLLRNMVGPGDVDDELEPEVKDECNTKYGDVVTVVIHEVPNVVPEEAVRIFVEFKRMESAIKAVVDLNGRFFGGRQVRAGFYNQEKFENMDLGG